MKLYTESIMNLNTEITSAHDNLHIYSDSQAAILSIISQDSEEYHNSMIWQIRENIMDISEKVDNIKLFTVLHTLV